MNTDTGEIREFESMAAAKRAGFTRTVKRMPVSGCKTCHGRGWLKRKGRKNKGKYRACSCVL